MSSCLAFILLLVLLRRVLLRCFFLWRLLFRDLLSSWRRVSSLWALDLLSSLWGWCGGGFFRFWSYICAVITTNDILLYWWCVFADDWNTRNSISCAIDQLFAESSNSTGNAGESLANFRISLFACLSLSPNDGWIAMILIKLRLVRDSNGVFVESALGNLPRLSRTAPTIARTVYLLIEIIVISQMEIFRVEMIEKRSIVSNSRDDW